MLDPSRTGYDNILRVELNDFQLRRDVLLLFHFRFPPFRSSQTKEPPGESVLYALRKEVSFHRGVGAFRVLREDGVREQGTGL